MVLLALAVAAAIFACTSANEWPAPANAALGSTDHALSLSVSNARAVRTDLAVAKKVFGTFEAIGRRNVTASRLHATVQYRAEDPDAGSGHGAAPGWSPWWRRPDSRR